MAAIALAGCGSKQQAVVEHDLRFEQLLVLYSAMFKSTGPPANEAAFKESINGRLKLVAETLGVTDVDALFVGRDGKPVVVRYGFRSTNPKTDIVAHEQVGVAGKRLVGTPFGTVEEVDEQRFRQLVPTPAK